MKTYTYKNLTVYYTDKAGISLEDIKDENDKFVHINLKEQKEIKRRINEQVSPR